MRTFFRVSALKTFLSLFLTTLFIIGSAGQVQSVTAKALDQADVPSNAFTLADFDYQTDINFQGVDETRTFGVTFPKNWAYADPAVLTVKFSHSDLLAPSSSLFVDWNGERVGTTSLTEENKQLGTLEIIIPAEKLIQGYNALRIGFYMGVSEDFCTDYQNQGVWAVIHNNTSIAVTPITIPRETELSLVPDILVDSSLLAENNVTLILPDSPARQHLNALAVMATKLGQLADWRNLDIQVMTINQARLAKPSGNLVLFATVDEIKDLSSGLLPEINAIYDQYAEHSPLEENDGVISLQASPFTGDYHLLALTGETPDALEKSARAAAYDELYEQSNGAWAVIRSLTEVTQTISDPLAVSFAELGYVDQVVTGTFEQTIQYSLPVSALWTVDSEAWLDLHFTHSELISRNLSMVSVLINSIPIASFELNSGNAEDGYKEIRIPLRYLDIGENIISFKVNMQFSDEVMLMQESCLPGATPRAWFNISADSDIRLPDVARQISLNLSHFPYGFSEPFTFAGFVYGVPSKMDAAGMSSLANIAATFGKATYGNPASIDLLLLNEDLSQFGSYNHVVLLGTADAVINDSINALLPLPLDAATGLPQDGSSLLIVETPSGIQTFVEAFQNEQLTPYLAFISNDMEGITMAGEYLANPALRYTINGNVAVITSAENASSYQIEPAGNLSGESPQINSDEPFEILTNYQSIWIIRVAIGIAGLSLLVLLIALFRKKPSSNES
ncbi:MAG: cellulose biosynthesis cyclic di-GMP-binding regulatory protein BcsB [Anaerolineaceae bacterium]|jgi:hypothetical protein|nr:cellulose biosynthesis cyclic di-GMP-binding regulatory protein BcsB [Anaerolineaceae bacterium]